MIKMYLAIMLGGCVGVAARTWASFAIASRWGETFPYGTMAVNITGCFLIGVIATVTGPNGSLLIPLTLRQAIIIGALGGYTTFSSFSLQTIHLLRDHEFLLATANAAGSLFGCLLATWLGIIVGSFINQRVL